MKNSSLILQTCLWAGLASTLPLSPSYAQGTAGKSQPAKTQYVAAKGDTAAPKDEPTTASPDPVVPIQIPNAYRLGPEDELTISVWHEPELSQGVTVRPDGAITLPLLNDVKVAGMTTQEVQALLTDKMKDLVNDPQVTVIVKAIKSQKVFLIGQVAKQGAYPLAGQTTLELIAEAGGLGPFAKKGSIYVLRKANGKETRIPFNFKQAVSGKGNNPALQSGDVVVVP